jgi:lincosamide nucleotidyltransferase A/C/D/E
MSATSLLALLGQFSHHGVDVCVGGGWSVDANVGRQTRQHSDADLWLPADQFDRAVVALVAAGIDRLFPWGDDRPWNFVLHDGASRRVDLHIYEAAEEGLVRYGGCAGETFPAEALQGQGTVDGRAVRCETPEWSLCWHTGYAPRPVDFLDVAELCEAFGFELPSAFR